MPGADPFDLQRFVDAQSAIYGQALAELRAGAKASHWMWFIFPQLAPLGRSPTAQHFGIRSVEEARAYFTHPLLGPRLQECIEALVSWSDRRSAQAILGPIDAMKLRSSLTLFEAASGEPRLAQVLDLFFDGRRDEATLGLLRQA